MAKTYHISRRLGSPGNRGSLKSPISPSTAHLIPLESGDSLLFDNVSTYGPLAFINKSGIKIGNYGRNERAVFTSEITLSGWSYVSPGIYSILVDALDIKVLRLNGDIKGKGRLPKTGYYKVQANHAGGQIAVDPLELIGSFVGGQVVVRKELYITDTFEIVSRVGDVLNYADTGSTYTIRDGFGYFVQNHVDCLTEVGDWCFDKVSKKVTMFFGSYRPTDFEVKVSVSQQGLLFNNCEDVEIYGIEANGFDGNGFEYSDCSGFYHEDVAAKNVGRFGFYAQDLKAQSMEFSKLRLNDAFSGGVYFGYLNHGIRVLDAVLENCGVLEGAAGSLGNGDSKRCGIALQWGDGNEISRTLIKNTGFNAAVCNGSGALIAYNTIDRFCLTNADGGGVYNYIDTGDLGVYGITKKLKILGNTITNGFGNIEGAADENGNPVTDHVVHGIYFDNNMHNCIASKNFVGYSNDAGMYLHDCQDIDVTDNVFVGSSRQILLSEDNGGEVSGITVRNNSLYCEKENQVFVHANMLSDFGTWDQNKYYHVGDQARFESRADGLAPYNAGVTFEGWQALSSDNGNVIPFSSYATSDPVDLGVATSKSIAAGRGDDYLTLGPVSVGEYILLEGSLAGDFVGFSLMLESDFLVGKKPKKISATGSFAIVLPVTIARANEAIIFLREEGSAGATITSMSAKKVTSADVAKSVAIFGNGSYLISTD